MHGLDISDFKGLNGDGAGIAPTWTNVLVSSSALMLNSGDMVHLEGTERVWTAGTLCASMLACPIILSFGRFALPSRFSTLHAAPISQAPQTRPVVATSDHVRRDRLMCKIPYSECAKRGAWQREEGKEGGREGGREGGKEGESGEF